VWKRVRVSFGYLVDLPEINIETVFAVFFCMMTTGELQALLDGSMIPSVSMERTLLSMMRCIAKFRGR